MDRPVGGGNSGSGVDSVNRQKEAITITGTAPIQVNTSATIITISTTALASGIKSIDLDENSLDQEQVELKGDSKQDVNNYFYIII